MAQLFRKMIDFEKKLNDFLNVVVLTDFKPETKQSIINATKYLKEQYQVVLNEYLLSKEE